MRRSCLAGEIYTVFFWGWNSLQNWWDSLMFTLPQNWTQQQTLAKTGFFLQARCILRNSGRFFSEFLISNLSIKSRIPASVPIDWNCWFTLGPVAPSQDSSGKWRFIGNPYWSLLLGGGHTQDLPAIWSRNSGIFMCHAAALSRVDNVRRNYLGWIFVDIVVLQSLPKSGTLSQSVDILS